MIENNIIPNINEIDDLFITENEWKESILIILKTWEKIELQVATNIKELYNTLSLDKDEFIYKTINNLVERAKKVKENFLSEKKIEPKEWINSSFFKLMEINKLFKIIKLNSEWFLYTKNKSLSSKPESILNYWRSDIISKERISNYLPILEKLFKAFERATFSKDDPRDYYELNDDEKRLLQYELSQPIWDIKENDEEENNINHIVPYEKNDQLKQIWIKEEIDKLFGYWIYERRFEQFNAYNEDLDLSPETSETLEISHKIYKKLVILWLYYKNELYIKTDSWTETFTWSECTKKSIDWNIYYKDHQEKYWWDKRYRFIMDSHWQKKDTYIPITDIVISDLSYWSLSDVICLLSKKWIAPVLSIILSNWLLPWLWEYRQREDNTNKDKELG